MLLEWFTSFRIVKRVNATAFTCANLLKCWHLLYTFLLIGPYRSWTIKLFSKSKYLTFFFRLEDFMPQPVCFAASVKYRSALLIRLASVSMQKFYDWMPISICKTLMIFRMSSHLISISVPMSKTFCLQRNEIFLKFFFFGNWIFFPSILARSKHLQSKKKKTIFWKIFNKVYRLKFIGSGW